MSQNTQKIGFIFAIVGTLLFSLKSIIIKLAYQEGLNYDSVLMLRMLISVPIYLAILLIVIRQKQGLISTTLIGKIFVLGFFGYYLASLLDLMSLTFITAQLERLTLFTYPLLTAILGRLFFKEMITKKIIISLFLTYFGLWIIMFKELSLSGDDVLFGTSLVFLSALSFAFYVLFSKKIIHTIGSILFTSIAMSASSFFILIHGLNFIDFNALIITKNAWGLMILLAIFCTVIPSFLLAESIKRIGSVQTGIVGTLGPIFTIILATQLLGEVVSTVAVFGIILIISGVFNLTVKKT